MYGNVSAFNPVCRSFPPSPGIVLGTVQVLGTVMGPAFSPIYADINQEQLPWSQRSYTSVRVRPASKWGKAEETQGYDVL